MVQKNVQKAIVLENRRKGESMKTCIECELAFDSKKRIHVKMDIIIQSV
jgi:hypothetical protein